MRVLVTGSEGKIGKEVVKLFKDHEVLGVDKKVNCNLAFDDLGFIKDFRPEVIIHLAASFERTDESASFHQINYEDNILATYRLNQLVMGFDYSPKSYVFASSYLVYDPDYYLSEKPNIVDCPINEFHDIKPRNLIGASKFYGENEINFIKRNVHKDMKVCHARIFRVFGEGGQEFVSRLLEWRKFKIPVEIWKPENRFDYIHTSDCASAIKSMVDYRLDGVYNVGTEKATSIKEIVELIGPKVVETKRDDLYEASCADTTEINLATGWRAKVDVLEWIKERL